MKEKIICKERKFVNEFDKEPYNVKELLNAVDDLLVNICDVIPVKLSDILSHIGPADREEMENVIAGINALRGAKETLNKAIELYLIERKVEEEFRFTTNEKLNKIITLLEEQEKISKKETKKECN